MGNACGTVGLLHCTLNASVSKGIPLGEGGEEIYVSAFSVGGEGKARRLHLSGVRLFIENRVQSHW